MAQLQVATCALYLQKVELQQQQQNETIWHLQTRTPLHKPKHWINGVWTYNITRLRFSVNDAICGIFDIYIKIQIKTEVE
jgi:hypothetical protein